MVKCGNWPIGICSLSLQADIDQLADAMNHLGIQHVHLAVRPALEQDGTKYLTAIRKHNWFISGTMIDFPQEDYSTLESIKATGGIVPDECWQENRKLFLEAAKVTKGLGARYLSMHAGFIDSSDDKNTEKLRERIKHLADAAAENQIMLLMETGQETAAGLHEFLEDLNHPAVAVNFDPANMILYNKGNPVEALKTLQGWVEHIHIKDAVRAKEPGRWGLEVPWGEGQVGANDFLRALDEIGFEGVLAIEREAGDDRFGDIKLAVEKLRNFNVKQK